MASFFCYYCPFRCAEWKEYMQHMFQCHSSTPNFRWKCGISGCLQFFRTYSAFASHLQRKHHGCDYVYTQLAGPSIDGSFEGSDATDEWSEDVPGALDDATILPSDSASLAQKSSALLLLALKESHLLSQSAINFAVGQMKQISNQILEEAKMSVKKRVAAGCNDIMIDDCFDIDPFDGLETEYLQVKFYKESFNLVVS